MAPPSGLPALKADFDRINRILGTMIKEVQRRLARVSPWTGMLDRLGGGVDEVVSNFSITRARADAWAFAQKLAPLEADRRAQVVEAKDRETARRAEKILRPGGRLFVPLLLCVRLREESDVPSVIAALSATSPAA